MPIDGLPDPYLHKLCRKCRKWHLPTDGTMQFPRSTGPLQWLHHHLQKAANPDKAQIFICFDCQKPKSVPLWIHVLSALLAMAIVMWAAWYFRLSELIGL